MPALERGFPPFGQAVLAVPSTVPQILGLGVWVSPATPGKSPPVWKAWPQNPEGGWDGAVQQEGLEENHASLAASEALGEWHPGVGCRRPERWLAKSQGASLSSRVPLCCGGMWGTGFTGSPIQVLSSCGLEGCLCPSVLYIDWVSWAS